MMIRMKHAVVLMCALTCMQQEANAQTGPDTQQAYKLAAQAFAESQQGNYAKAVDLYKQSEAIYDKIPTVHVGLSNCLVRLQRAAEAVPEAQEAIRENAADEWAWVNLAAAYVESGKLQEGADTAGEFLRRFPNSSKAEGQRELIARAKRELERRRLAGAPSTAESYLPLALELGAHRWPASSMPIKVWIGNGKGVSGWVPADNELVEQALQEWSDATNGKISFSLQHSKKDADMVIEWSNTVEIGDSKECGIANESHHIPGYDTYKAQINLAVRHPADGTELPAAEIESVALHEIGHALGLGGHSDAPTDIMFNTITPGRKISARDVYTLNQLYSGWIDENGRLIPNQQH